MRLPPVLIHLLGWILETRHGVFSNEKPPDSDRSSWSISKVSTGTL